MMSSHTLREDNLAHALHTWQKKNEQELDVIAGDIVTVLSISEDKQWALCVSQQHDRGYVPCDYLQGVETPNSQSATSDNTKDEFGYLKPTMSCNLQQPTLYLNVKRLQEVRQGRTLPLQGTPEVQMVPELSQDRSVQTDGGAGGAEQQQTQNQAVAASLSADDNGPGSPASIASSSGASSLDYETDERLVCYRVTKKQDTTSGQQCLEARVGDLVLTAGDDIEELVWCALCANPSRGGYVPKSALLPASSLDQQPWFLGLMTREEVESLLLNPSVEEGTFVVRESETTAGYVISIKGSEGTIPMLRHRKCNEADGLYSAWSQVKFRDIPELVKYHSDGRELSLPYDKYHTSSSATHKPLTLLPIPSPRETQSSYANNLFNSEEARNPQTTPPIPPKPAEVSLQSNAPSLPPRQVHQTVRPESLNLSHSAHLRPSGPNNENQGQGKPPPGLVQSQGFFGQNLRPVRPITQGIMSYRHPAPVMPKPLPMSTHEVSSNFVPSQTNAAARRNSVRRPMNPPPPPPPSPPVSSNQASQNISPCLSPFEGNTNEGNAQTSIPPQLTRAQAYARTFGVPLVGHPCHPLQHSISVFHAPANLHTTSPVRSLSVPQIFASQKGPGAIPNVDPRNVTAPQLYAQENQSIAAVMPSSRLRVQHATLPKNQDDIRAIELENRAMESEFESWRVIRLEKIGSGHYGEVWKVQIKNTKTIMALKTFNKERMEEQLFMAEAKTMMALKHPNLVKLRGVCSEPQSIFMLLDLHSHGSVLDYLTKGMRLSQGEKLNVMKGVLSGMKYLSEEGFVHRDLAARNVLMADDKTPKVADFGLAQMIKADGRAEHDNQKTPWKWTAPEALCGGNLWTTKCDVWSYGVFCWELFINCATQPYPDINNSRTLLHSLRTGTRLNRPAECTETIFGIIYQCWEFDHNARVSFEDLWNFLYL